MPPKQYHKHEQQLRKLIEVDQLTQHEVAHRLGVHRSTIEHWCRRFGLRTQRTGPRSGEKHTGWKGGRVLRKGYWYVYAPDHPHATKKRYVLEHRLVMEAILGRYLDPKEVVHHLNKDRQDNRPANLGVFPSNADHLRHELTGHVPQWTPEGRRRTLEGARKPRTRRPLKADARRRTQTSDRQPS